MKVENIHIEYVQKSGFSSRTNDGTCHTKVLPYLSVVQAVEGSYDIQLEGGAVQSTEECGFFIAPSNVQQRIVHRADPRSKTITCRWIFIKVKINEFHYFDEVFSFPTILPPPLKREMNAVFDRIFGADNAFEEYIGYHQLLHLLSLCATEKECSLSPCVERALHFIKDRYREKITVQDIAKQAHLSPSHLFSAFKKQMGVSPICFVNNYRLAIAAELLLSDTGSIGQIAEEVGIHDTVYFNKIFKKHYQTSPSQYRRIFKNGNEPLPRAELPTAR